MEGSIYTFALFIDYLSERFSRLIGQHRNAGIQQGCIFRTKAAECGVLELQADSVVLQRINAA